MMIITSRASFVFDTPLLSYLKGVNRDEGMIQRSDILNEVEIARLLLHKIYVL